MADDLEQSGSAVLSFDDLGRAYWALSGPGGDADMEPGWKLIIDPQLFPPGTTVRILEPPESDARSEAFYKHFGCLPPDGG